MQCVRVIVDVENWSLLLPRPRLIFEPMNKEELRPCRVQVRQAYTNSPAVYADGWFHLWFEKRDMEDGQPSSELYAIVEMADGKISYYYPKDVQFTDRT